VTAVIGLLLCDHVDPELRVPAGQRDYPEIYESLLRGVDDSLSVRTYDTVAGELPGDLSECEAWVITGSRHDANGSDPWLLGLHRFIRALHEQHARAVGVCFGHQAVAHALGGQVERADQWKAGPHLLTVGATAWFGSAEVQIHAMHRDEVTRLPEGCRSVGEGDTARYPIYLAGDNLLCIQDHPEFDDGYTAALVRARRERMGSEVADAALARIGATPVDGDVVARWLVDFLLDRRVTGASS
jgi:GMP synthase-like glutamine amidotransferase